PAARTASAASGWMRACVGSATIGARVPSKSRPSTASSAAATNAAYRSGAYGLRCSMGVIVLRCGRERTLGGGRSGEVGGEDDRQPVELHRVDRGADPGDAEVAGEQPAGRLEAGREVDGGL